jgi:uncharacterized protein (DUF488 family)
MNSHTTPFPSPTTDPNSIPVFTIGFTQKTAEQFFEKLRAAGVKRIVDVRLNKTSQLAGFSKRDDLRFFAKAILNVDYVEAPLLAPSKELFTKFKTNKGRWEDYQRDFNALLTERRIEDKIDPAILAGGCLLCSEPEPDECHRRLVVEYLQRHWGNLSVTHL